MTTTVYDVQLGWNRVDVEHVELRAADFRAALVAARAGWGRSWTVVLVTDPLTDQEIDVAVKRSDPKDMSPEEWATRRLAPPTEVPIVSVEAFLNALHPNVLGHDAPLSERPVWIVLDGMLYTPTQIGIDPQHGAIMIVPNREPSGMVAKQDGAP